MSEPAANNKGRWKSVLILVLALACGFLTFNFHYIIKTSHIHLSLAHHHRTTAFCAFTLCKFHEDMQEVPTGAAATPSTTSTATTGATAAGGATATTAAATTAAATTAKATAAGGTSTGASDAGAAAANAAVADDAHLVDLQKIMETRLCGSPAIDGYAHVVPKCLEDSPTAKWWYEYYKSGGKQSELTVHIEQASDYDGLAVFWGINNKKKTAEECAQHCLKHMPNTVPGPFEKLPCNAFAFCPDEVCFEPDAHHHTKGDCWLKFTEGPAAPQVNMRGNLPASYRQRHAQAPFRVQWISGVLLPPGVKLTNGTFGPRWEWRRRR